MTYGGRTVSIVILLLLLPSTPAQATTIVHSDHFIPSGSPISGPVTHHCSDDGTSGKRIQGVFLYHYKWQRKAFKGSDLSARFSELLSRASSIIDPTNTLHLRFVHGPDCAPIIKLQHSGSTILAGAPHPNRKYVYFTQSPFYCGMSSIAEDDRPGPENRNNNSGWAWVSETCWYDYIVTHEIIHLLGGVQHSAPNSTLYHHCTDESDIMCYSDSDTTVIRQVCPYTDPEPIDCNHDDYFSLDPAPGSYLDTHWNVANSIYLDVVTYKPIS